MPDKDFNLPSGAKLHVTRAPFADAMALQTALIKSNKGVPLPNNPLNMEIGDLKDAVISAVASDEVREQLDKCLGRCTYNNVRVTNDLFDDAKLGDAARQDYYVMVWHVIEVNCGPFFFHLFSKWKDLMAKRIANQKSASSATTPPSSPSASPAPATAEGTPPPF